MNLPIVIYLTSLNTYGLIFGCFFYDEYFLTFINIRICMNFIVDMDSFY